MPVTTNTRKLAALLGASGAGIGTDGLLQLAAMDENTVFDDDLIQTNIALVAFKAATNGSLAKYNLQDQVIDEYVDATGIDGTPSTNHVLASGAYSGLSGGVDPPAGGDSTDTSVSGYTTRVFTTSRALTSYGAGNVSILVVGGGASGGAGYGGGGGAGGLIYKATHALTANTYDMVIGAGGAGVTATAGLGNNGVDTTVTINGGAVEFTAKGGGGGGSETSPFEGKDGGSGGGNSYGPSNPGQETQSGMSGDSGTYAFSFDGGVGSNTGWKGGGGGGAGSVGQAANVGDSDAGDGGAGKNMGAIFGTAVGDGGWFASGGGGGKGDAGGGGSASSGGGGAGGNTSGATGTAGTANTGGGSGGAASTATTDSTAGGSGIVLVRYANADFPGLSYNDITLQSTDTEAEAQPTKADMVMLIEDAGSGVATLGTHIKGYISRDSGTTFTEGTLVDEGDWGTNKRILAFHDLDISGQPADQTMCYKITTHSASATYHTKIHATSIGWR